MGKILYDYFVEAGKIGGIKARTKLSLLTQTSSLQAKSLIDSEENIKQFDKAISKISDEFKNKPEQLSLTPVKSSCSDATLDLRRYLTAFVDLASQRALFIHDLKATLHRITESISYTMEVERVSIWLMGKDKIVCKDLFLQKTSIHTTSEDIYFKDYPKYFKAIRSERTLPAHDVEKDDRTQEMLESYLNPLEITSMLDVPIWAKGKMVGIICHEHIGKPRKWTADEENFAYIMSNVVSIALEAHKIV